MFLSIKVHEVRVENGINSFMSPHHPQVSSLLSDSIIGHPNEKYLSKIFFIDQTQSFDDIEGLDNDFYLWHLYQTEVMFECLDNAVSVIGGIGSSDIRFALESSYITDPYDTWMDIQDLLIVDKNKLIFENELIDYSE